MRFVKTKISLLIQFRQLKKVILKKADKTRAIQFKKKVLFSTKYIQYFLYRIVQYTTLFVIELFDFIIKSRLDNKFRQNYKTYICVFLNLTRRYFLSIVTINRFFVFSIIINVYLSRIHCRRFACSNYIILICLAVFDFQYLFRLLYRQHFFRIFQKIFEFDNQIVFCCSILEKILTAQFQAVEINLQNSTLLRAETLRLNSKYLK